MKTIKILSAILLLGAASGCSTIYFHNGGQTGYATEESEWHHDGVFGLVEFSDPVNMSARCEDSKHGWDTVKTERTFLNGLVSGLTWSLYDPWEVSMSCNNKKTH
jgi:hypothetical protein